MVLRRFTRWTKACVQARRSVTAVVAVVTPTVGSMTLYERSVKGLTYKVVVESGNLAHKVCARICRT